jgi:hypothetical protein
LSSWAIFFFRFKAAKVSIACIDNFLSLLRVVQRMPCFCICEYALNGFLVLCIDLFDFRLIAQMVGFIEILLPYMSRYHLLMVLALAFSSP